MTQPERCDVAVIGAGIQGVGVAQALAAAGHSVVLIEEQAPASGTSSRSSKLIHGGLRYLETFQLRLVFESLSERAILQRIAPHLVRLVPFHIPIYGDTSRGRWTIRAGLSLYAILGRLRRDARFESVPRAGWDLLDGLRTNDLRAVFRYFDGQTDDAALCRAVLASAQELGAQLRLPATLLAGRREGDGWSLSIREGSEATELRARCVVNAAGPWINHVLDHLQPPPPRREVDLVGGTHIELEGQLQQGIYYTEAPSDRRAVFTMPWKDRILVGTTEQPFDGDPRQVSPTQEEVEYLMGVHRHYFPESKGDVLETWSGLRVLPRGQGAAFSRPRDVTLVADRERRPTLLSIYGGKLTGYRHTAAKVERRLAPSLPQAERQADTATLRLPEDPDPAATPRA